MPANERKGLQFVWWGAQTSPPWDVLVQMCRLTGMREPKWRLDFIACELRYW